MFLSERIEDYRETSHSDFYKTCYEKEFPLPDCNLNTSAPRMLQNYPLKEDLIQVGFILSQQRTKTTYEKKFDFSNFFLYLCSIVGIWFGFNILALFELAKTPVVKRVLSVRLSQKQHRTVMRT